MIAKEVQHPDETEIPKDYIVPLGDADCGEPNSEINVTINKPPRMVRRTSSLYAAIKRMKSTKKSRQVANRKPLKNPRNKINADTGTAIAKTTRTTSDHNVVKSSSILGPIGYKIRSVESSVQNISAVSSSSSLPRRINSNATIASTNAANNTRRRLKKTTIKSSIEQTLLRNERTSAVKQGTKRMKIVSQRITKTRPEIGESSSDRNPGVSDDDRKNNTLEIVRFRNRLNAKNTSIRCRKSYCSLKTTEAKSKTRKTTKLKAKT